MTNRKLNVFFDAYSNRTTLALKFIYSLFFCFVFIRMNEFISLSRQFNINSLIYLEGILYDFFAAVVLGFFFSTVVTLLPEKIKTYSTIPLFILLIVFSTIGFILSNYFLVTLFPLDHTFFVYSVKEMLYISGASVGISFRLIMQLLLLCTGIPLLLFFWLRKKKKFSSFVSIILSLPILLSIVFFRFLTPQAESFEKNRDYYQSVNKIVYFGESICYFLLQTHELEAPLLEIQKSMIDFQTKVAHGNYCNLSYPFLKENTEKDVIGSFFEFYQEPPNIVLIIIESLSRNISGYPTESISFTPFIDSLASKSLYWENCLSTSERTFNILPTTLASVPYSEKGFAAITDKQKTYPDILSLPKLLAKNGYSNYFFYGGWSFFDRMSHFLSSTDSNFFISDYKAVDKHYDMIKEDEKGFSWGLSDQGLYEMAMDVLDTLQSKNRLEIYMTLSTHDPFYLTEESLHIYENKVRETVNKLGENLSQNRKKEIENKMLPYSVIMYADDCLRHFFATYEKREDFKNTLFFITADHYMPSVSDYNFIKKYHVPLLVYSPMLKTTKTFPSVVSTADITPTIFAMLKENFGFKTPKNIPWLGRSLDTTSVFRSKNFIPMMRVNRDINEMLYNDYFLSEEKLYRIDEKLNLTPLKDDLLKKEEMIKLLNDFKLLNYYSCETNQIYVE